MKNNRVINYKITKNQPSPMMTEAIRSMIREWAEHDRAKKDEKKASNQVCVSKLMP